MTLHDRWPRVDVVVPARNAAAVLPVAIESFLTQEYPGPIHAYVAVGPSTDATRQVADDLAGRDDRITVLDNPTGRTPDALNIAIAAGSGSVVVRLDAQSSLPPDYVRRAVELLRETGAVNVGGIQRAIGETPFERAVAAAMNSPLGAGNARYRLGGAPGPVDTVYLGAFRREALERAGCYDPSLVRNQDYELNWRLRQKGGIVYFHPDLEVGYRPRGSLAALARQYLEYGRWKRVVLRRHPGSVRLRQLLPPAAALANLAGVAFAVVTPWALAVPATYVVAVTVGAVATSPDRSLSVRARLPVVLATMHHAWATGMLLPFAVASQESGDTRVRTD